MLLIIVDCCCLLLFVGCLLLVWLVGWLPLLLSLLFYGKTSFITHIIVITLTIIVVKHDAFTLVIVPMISLVLPPFKPCSFLLLPLLLQLRCILFSCRKALTGVFAELKPRKPQQKTPAELCCIIVVKLFEYVMFSLKHEKCVPLMRSCCGRADISLRHRWSPHD